MSQQPIYSETNMPLQHTYFNFITVLTIQTTTIQTILIIQTIMWTALTFQVTILVIIQAVLLTILTIMMTILLPILIIIVTILTIMVATENSGDYPGNHTGYPIHHPDSFGDFPANPEYPCGYLDHTGDDSDHPCDLPDDYPDYPVDNNIPYRQNKHDTVA